MAVEKVETHPGPAARSPKASTKMPDRAEQRRRNEAAIRLLDEWLADESGYDEETWPIVKRLIEENRPSYRKRFDG